MSRHLPYGNFKWCSESELIRLKEYILNILDDNDIGYTIKCDVEYPESLHDYHNDYPFFPQHKTIKYEELSDYQQKLISKSKYNPSKKLIADLENKVNIIVDYRTFKKKLPGICIKVLNSILPHFTLIKLMRMRLSPYILMDNCLNGTRDIHR